MNSKLPDEQQISDKQKYIFQKRKSYEISSTDIYIGKDLEFITHVTWLKLYLVKIKSSGITSQQAGKKTFVIQYQKVLIFLRIALFHFTKSLSTIQFPVYF